MGVKLFGHEICPFGRSLELIEDSQGRLSTPSLIALIGVSVLSIVIILDAEHSKTDPTIIGVYATLIASLFGIKKGFDSSENKAQIRADATPSTVISDNTKVQTESGDINIKPKRKK